DDHLILVEDRRTAKSVFARKWSRAHQPFLLAGEIICGHDHVLLIQKGDIDQVAISGRSAGSMAVEGVFGFQRRTDDGLLPKYFPPLSLQTKQDTLLGVEGGNRKDALLPNNGRSMP